MNFWIKTIYRAHGSNASPEWLAMISPCIDILRHLARKVHNELGSHQGAKHTSPDLQRDIERLMQSLLDRDVYRIEQGRVVDVSDDGEESDSSQYGAVVNCITEGYNRLAEPLREFNHAFRRLQERCRAQPLVGQPYFDVPSATTAAPSSPSVPDATPPQGPPSLPPTDSEDADAPCSDGGSEDDFDSDAESDGEGEGSLYLDQYFSLDNAGDVALDMDIIKDAWDSTVD